MTQPDAVDLIVRDAYLITMDAERRIFTDGAIAVRGHTSVAVGPGRQILPAYTAARTISARGEAVHPGFIE